ncbi:beta-glucosidase [Pseudohyphozyma bogoriensis]|nr:beta-glucosidase [Pseudohyphozyma bogoriensis]
MVATRPPPTIDPEAILKQLSTDEKVDLLAGVDSWHTFPIPRLGVPKIRVSDGPNGVRGTKFFGGAAASCFPAATAMGASFDTDLVRRVGEALGDECRARGVACLLGPTTNLARNPRGGRGFESYGEDPYLLGVLGKAWVEGVQSRKVMTTPKHFVANEQEYNRRSNNSVIDERTLHELYLEPFRIQCLARPSGFMTSYNRVNGTHVAESPYFLRKILRGDFEFKGMLMSDWSGTYSSAEAIKASLDLEMPGPTKLRGELLQRDITSGKLTVADIDECALRVLRFVKEAMESGIPPDAEEGTIDTPAVRALLKESAAAGVVLLKNTQNTLPISAKKGMKIAVIGPNAKVAQISGGGSASLAPTYKISPLEAITTYAESVGAEVSYEEGADISRWSPLLSKYLRLPGGKVEDEPQCRFDFYDQNPHTNTSLEPLYTKLTDSSYAYFIDGIPSHIPMRTTFIPDADGTWEFGLGVAGQANLYINDELIVENRENQQPGLLFFTTGAEERIGRLDVKAGQAYKLEVHFTNFKQINPTGPYAGRRGGIRVGGQRKFSQTEQIGKAVELSKASDVTILVIGTTTEWESESYDRDDIKLPAGSDALVEAVLAANPSTIVVNQSGMPVEFPWITKCSSLLQAFFGGNECGTAIADAVFGLANPSGKLPVSFPNKLEDCSSHGYFGDFKDTVYAEGIKVGYRYFNQDGNPDAMFPFGYGLSYTTFAYSNLTVQKLPNYGLSANFSLTNTGRVAGAEAPQVYIHHPQSRVERPLVELKGFAKVFLQPGEKKEVTVNMDHSALSYYDVSTKSWVGEKGTFEVRVGPSSAILIGLTSALVLARKGYKVHVVARDMPEDKDSQGFASPWAGLTEPSRRVYASSQVWESLIPKGLAIRLPDTRRFESNEEGLLDHWYKDVVPKYSRIPQEDCPPNSVGVKFDTLSVNSPVYILWLKNSLEALGATFEKRQVASLDAAFACFGDVDCVVNATGLGAI